jgi:hypothetical protein
VVVDVLGLDRAVIVAPVESKVVIFKLVMVLVPESEIIVNIDRAFIGVVVAILIEAVVVPLTGPVHIPHVEVVGGKSPNKPS